VEGETNGGVGKGESPGFHYKNPSGQKRPGIEGKDYLGERSKLIRLKGERNLGSIRAGLLGEKIDSDRPYKEVCV